jgi:hypothetical protein
MGELYKNLPTLWRWSLDIRQDSQWRSAFKQDSSFQVGTLQNISFLAENVTLVLFRTTTPFSLAQFSVDLKSVSP